MICEIYELYLYFVVDFLNDWWGVRGEWERMRGNGERMWNARGSLWYRLLFSTGTEEDFRHRLKNPVS